MKEKELISKTNVLATRQSLGKQLKDGGLKSGATILVHTSMSNLGWVLGGAVSIIQALMDVVGAKGTVVMPSHTGYLTDPAEWSMPPVPKDWMDTIRNEMPAYDPAISPTRNMGAVAELFRTWPGAQRSLHPTCSFSAIGLLATKILSNHALADPLGKTSPLGKLYTENAYVLLLGVDFDVCTMLHLAEQLAWPAKPKNKQASPIMQAGERKWITYEEFPLLDSSLFLTIGERMKKERLLVEFPIGTGVGKIIPAKKLVDYAQTFWETNKDPDNPLSIHH